MRSARPFPLWIAFLLSAACFEETGGGSGAGDDDGSDSGTADGGTGDGGDGGGTGDGGDGGTGDGGDGTGGSDTGGGVDTTGDDGGTTGDDGGSTGDDGGTDTTGGGTTTTDETTSSQGGATTTSGPEVILDMVLDLCNYGQESVLTYDPNADPTIEFLQCPGDTSDSRGSVTVIDDPILDDGQTYPGQGLFIRPPVSAGVNAQLNVVYDFITIEAGDRLQTTVGCAPGKWTCDVTIQVNVTDALNNITPVISTFQELTDGDVTVIDEPLDFLAGENVGFAIIVMANGNAGDDWSYWATPRVIRP
jgi:hypothetical protein